MNDALNNSSNPRALITIMANVTGMRVGEIVALKKEDIGADLLHIHRQQIIENVPGPDGKNHTHFVDVPYTKNERCHPHDGRYYPITSEIRKILDLADKIPGESEYLFHDPNKNGFIKKDGYIHYLNRRCRKLGIHVTNNHAFRMAHNSRLIAEGFDVAQRSYMNGHTMETNLSHYSLTGNNRVPEIMKKMKSLGELDMHSEGHSSDQQE